MEEELKELIERNQWDQLYNRLRIESHSRSNAYSTSIAAKERNRHLNRYRDVYPYDHARVELSDFPDTDYINASLVKAPQANRRYILAQGPLPATVGHFWLMIWQQRSQAVLMLNRVVEKGQTRCHQYWPPEGEDLIFKDVGLRIETIHSDAGDHYTIRTFRVTNLETEETREIFHFHYTKWPDFGTPNCPDSFLAYLKAVREKGVLDEKVGPAVVHCSAGIGRSGTFILVDTCLDLIEREGIDKVNIKEILLEMRTYRLGLIQTPGQLKFSYLSIVEGAKQWGILPEKSCLHEISTRNEPNQNGGGNDDDSSGGSNGPPPLPPPRSSSLREDEAAKILNNCHMLESLDPELQRELLRTFLGQQGGVVSDDNSRDSGSSPSSATTNNSSSTNGNSNPASPSSSSATAAAAASNQGPNREMPADQLPSTLHFNVTKTDSSTSSASTGGGSSSASADVSATAGAGGTCILSTRKMEERKRETLRRRKETSEQMNNKIAEIKKGMRDTEDKHRRWYGSPGSGGGYYRYLRYLAYGGLAVAAGGTLIYLRANSAGGGGVGGGPSANEHVQPP